ncbi:MAG: hypothetical protein NC121_13185 [Blautia sp.]|nr:hypothetical protein [Blautia sp.]
MAANSLETEAPGKDFRRTAAEDPFRCVGAEVQRRNWNYNNSLETEAPGKDFRRTAAEDPFRCVGAEVQRRNWNVRKNYDL